MKRYALGTSGIEVSQMGYGIAFFGTRVPYERGADLLDRYRATGGNLIDTAHVYATWIEGGLGASERFLGRYLRERGREGWVVTTKGGHIATTFYSRPDSFMAPELVRRDLSESLERLELDQVDMYSYHRDDERIPVEELVDAAHEITQNGFARVSGVSNWRAERVAKAKAYAESKGWPPFAVVQNQWSLATPNWNDDSPGRSWTVTQDEIGLLAETGIVVTAYTPTANGYFALDTPKNKHFSTQENSRRKERAQQLAKERGVTANRVALAWLLAQDIPVVPLLGTGDTEHLHDALEALKLKLTPRERDWLRDG